MGRHDQSNLFLKEQTRSRLVVILIREGNELLPKQSDAMQGQDAWGR